MAGDGRCLPYASLTILVVQSTLHILTLRYVRTRGGDMFLSSTVVVVAEGVKVIMSLLMILYTEGSVYRLVSSLNKSIVRQPMDCLKVAIPSLVYTIQNNLLILALSNLDPATFQVYYQLKILTSALFSVAMLNKKLSRIQWCSLILLFIGISIVETETRVEKSLSLPAGSHTQNRMVGIIAVLISCFLSGFAGVYFEKILKESTQSLWLRNVQLGGLGIMFGTITMEIKEGIKIEQLGFFYGYDIFVWLTILLQSVGGLLVAVVVKYTDNIKKGFASSVAIVASSVLSVYIFGFHLTFPFSVGAMFVIVSVYLYAKFQYKEVPPTLIPVSRNL